MSGAGYGNHGGTAPSPGKDQGAPGLEASKVQEASRQEGSDHASQVPGGQEDRKAAGPHAKEALTDHEKTPGAGTLPQPGADGDVDPGAG